MGVLGTILAVLGVGAGGLVIGAGVQGAIDSNEREKRELREDFEKNTSELRHMINDQSDRIRELTRTNERLQHDFDRLKIGKT